MFDPLHYLALIERKINALDQAAPLADWKLPDEFATLRRLLEARMGKPGKREFVQVLRLMETFAIDDVAAPCVTPSSVAQSASTRSSIWCCAGSNVGHHGSTWRSIPTCRRRRSRRHRRAPTWSFCAPVASGHTNARAKPEPRHERHSASSAGPSPQSAEAADVPARVRQDRPPVRGRGRRLSALPAAARRRPRSSSASGAWSTAGSRPPSSRP